MKICYHSKDSNSYTVDTVHKKVTWCDEVQILWDKQMNIIWISKTFCKHSLWKPYIYVWP